MVLYTYNLYATPMDIDSDTAHGTESWICWLSFDEEDPIIQHEAALTVLTIKSTTTAGSLLRKNILLYNMKPVKSTTSAS